MNDLTNIEQGLLTAAAAGERLDLSRDRTGATSNACAQLPPNRQLRANVVEGLCVGDYPVHHRGIRIRGARITGQLDLRATNVEVPLHLDGCCFDAPLRLELARLRDLGLTGSLLPGLQADSVDIQGNAMLDGGSKPRAKCVWWAQESEEWCPVVVPQSATLAGTRSVVTA